MEPMNLRATVLYLLLLALIGWGVLIAALVYVVRPLVRLALVLL